MRTISGRRHGRGRRILAATPAPAPLGAATLRPGALAIAALVAAALASGAAGLARAQASSAEPPWQCLDAICERALRLEDVLQLELQSRREAPVWIGLEAATLENLSARPPLPWTFRLEPGETRAAGTLAIQDPTLPYAQQLRWTVLSGNPDARHDDRWRYCMPFGGEKPVRISQGYEGEATHQGLGAYALDFPMPIGTPVRAARGGRVVASPDDGLEDGTQADAREPDQHVVIEHNDGTLAMYAHLRRGDAARPGQRIACGERIGYSGDTGRATGPHLHFDVYRIRRDGQRQTIPVRFWDGTAAGFEPRADQAYAPGCTPPRPDACGGR